MAADWSAAGTVVGCRWCPCPVWLQLDLRQLDGREVKHLQRRLLVQLRLRMHKEAEEHARRWQNVAGTGRQATANCWHLSSKAREMAALAVPEKYSAQAHALLIIVALLPVVIHVPVNVNIVLSASLTVLVSSWARPTRQRLSSTLHSQCITRDYLDLAGGMHSKREARR